MYKKLLKGIHVEILYPLCGEEPKSVSHHFVTCEVASRVWYYILCWL